MQGETYRAAAWGGGMRGLVRWGGLALQRRLANFQRFSILLLSAALAGLPLLPAPRDSIAPGFVSGG